MDEAKENEDISPPEVTSGKKKSIWFQETLKEAKEQVGEPKRLMRESRALERFGSYLAMVNGITYFNPTNFL
jgi:hypothetical protein